MPFLSPSCCRLGESVPDHTMDGRDILLTVTQPSRNRWIEVQRPKSDPKKLDTILIRDFSDTAMTVVLKINDVVAKTVFKRKTVTPFSNDINRIRYLRGLIPSPFQWTPQAFF